MDKYREYAMQVVNGDIPACIYVKQACERYLSFFGKYDFKPEKCERVINFIAKLKHWKGEYKDKNFILQPFQKWLIYSIFGFYHKNSNKRVTNYVYIELPRKNGKTALIAAICLYMMIADGENGSEVELVANSAKQAQICFEMASYYCSSIDPKNKYFKRYRDKIKFDLTKSSIQVLSADASGNDGYNSYCFVLDEAHEQKDSKLWDVMVSSQGMRKNPLGIIITTAGFNKFGFCYQYRDTCLKILNGTVVNDSQFAAIYTIDENDDWMNPEVWAKANPSFGVTVVPENFEQQILQAKINPSSIIGTKTKNLNMWVDAMDIWLPSEVIANASKKFKIEDIITPETRCYIGVDLAATSDLTAVAYLLPQFTFDENGYPHLQNMYADVKYYLPESTLYNNSNSHLYRQWANKGYLTITEGNVTDYNYITNDLVKMNEKVQIEKICYDAYNSTQWAIDTTNKGFNLVPFAQGLGNFNRPTKEFERLILQGKIVLQDNPINRWCLQNVQMKYDHNENCKPDKATKQNKIDGVIAMVQALGGFLEENQYYDYSL